ncbi:MAG: hypothetical protein U5N86_08960 [Planctomycetota bacterium]|nr:hypothetical protein [Planctomycetota bacterium]
MERLTRIIIISVVFAALCAFSQPAFADGLRAVLDDDTVSRSGPIASTYIIQACRQANAEDADYLILEFDTSRGRMNLADVAAQAIVDCSATTVAFIRGECKGAPLYLALHCDLIYASFGASLSPYRFDEHGNAVPVEQEVADQLLKKMKNAVNKASRTTKNVNLELFFDKDAELYEMNFAPEAEELLKREPLRYHRIGGKAGLVVFALRELKEQLNIAFKGQLLESPRKSEFSPPLSVIEDSSRLRWLGVLDGFAMNLKALESELNVTGKALGTVTTVDVSVIQKLGVRKQRACAHSFGHAWFPRALPRVENPGHIRGGRPCDTVLCGFLRGQLSHRNRGSHRDRVIHSRGGSIGD